MPTVDGKAAGPYQVSGGVEDGRVVVRAEAPDGSGTTLSLTPAAAIELGLALLRCARAAEEAHQP